MLPYWLLFSYFAGGALLRRPREEGRDTFPLLALGALILALLVGLRHEVGADWEQYRFMFSYAAYADLGRQLRIGDPAYQTLNWLMQRAGGGLWTVNLICGAIFSWGLWRLCREQREPWLSMLVAVPYLVVVVAMGYTRQAVAIGILMAGLANLVRGGSTARFILFVGAAALFHKSAVIVLPLVAFADDRNRPMNLALAAAATVLFYNVFLEQSVDALVRNYIVAEYSSQGAIIRVAMSLIPALIFLARPSLFDFDERERKIWRNFSLAAVALAVALIVSPSSTAVDRLALYVLPLQIVILARVPGSLLSRGLGISAIVAYSFAVQFVWLNFATHAEYWLPYQFTPLFEAG